MVVIREILPRLDAGSQQWNKYGAHTLADLTDLIAAELEKQGEANVDAIVKQRARTHRRPITTLQNHSVARMPWLAFPDHNSWLIGAGIAGNSIDVTLTNLNSPGLSVWTTFVRPFGENKSLILFGKADIDHDIDIGQSLTSSANSYHTAISLATEEPEQWKLEATASYHFRDVNTATFDDQYFQFSAGGAYKIR